MSVDIGPEWRREFRDNLSCHGTGLAFGDEEKVLALLDAADEREALLKWRDDMLKARADFGVEQAKYHAILPAYLEAYNALGDASTAFLAAFDGALPMMSDLQVAFKGDDDHGEPPPFEGKNANA